MVVFVLRRRRRLRLRHSRRLGGRRQTQTIRVEQKCHVKQAKLPQTNQRTRKFTSFWSLPLQPPLPFTAPLVVVVVVVVAATSQLIPITLAAQLDCL